MPKISTKWLTAIAVAPPLITVHTTVGPQEGGFDKTIRTTKYGWIDGVVDQAIKTLS